MIQNIPSTNLASPSCMHEIHNTLFNIRYSMLDIQYTVHNMQCPMFNLLYLRVRWQSSKVFTIQHLHLSAVSCPIVRYSIFNSIFKPGLLKAPHADTVIFILKMYQTQCLSSFSFLFTDLKVYMGRAQRAFLDPRFLSS